MPLDLPNLDDRRYNDLVAEALSLIPAYAPEWTNHNPSDPGITLIELFAYFTEILIYRLNRITPANQLAFLKILNGSDWKLSDINGQPLGKSVKDLTPEDIRSQIPITISNLRKIERAVSTDDFEKLSMSVMTSDNKLLVVRAHCIGQRNLEDDLEGTADRPGHVSLIVLLAENIESEHPDAISNVKKYLSDYLLVTTRLHVIKAVFLGVIVRVSVVLLPDQNIDAAQLSKMLLFELKKYFNPYPDEARGSSGWPWGRNIYISEIYALIDQLPYIDYVKEEYFSVTANKNGRDLAGIGILVKLYELVEIEQVIVKIDSI